MSSTSRPGFGADGGLEAGKITGFDQGRGDAETRQGVQQHVDGAAVQRSRSDDMTALTHQGGDGQMQGRLARGQGYGADPALQGRHTFFEDRRGRVGDTGVKMPRLLQIEQRRRMSSIFEDIGAGLIDWHSPGAVNRVGMLPRM
jgi:hypothetical protein